MGILSAWSVQREQPRARWPYYIRRYAVVVKTVGLVLQVAAFWYLGGVEHWEWILDHFFGGFRPMWLEIWIVNVFLAFYFEQYFPVLAASVWDWPWNDVLGLTAL